MQYPNLSLSELKRYEKEFIQYLSVNGIEAKEWELIKQEKPDKMAECIQDFSSAIWQSRLQKIKFLNLWHPERLLSFALFADRATLIGLEGDCNFTELEGKSLVEMQQWLQERKSILRIFKQDKTYQKPKDQEVYQLVKLGAKVADEDVFKLLKQVHDAK